MSGVHLLKEVDFESAVHADETEPIDECGVVRQFGGPESDVLGVAIRVLVEAALAVARECKRDGARGVELTVVEQVEQAV
ncbi:MAG: hypothetical protein RI568_10145 [Natronomonas sp.]|uniref:hypothetical protein n=1 Tax=Natronomonas sp. TaxID=2184060 RepID=UPI0028703668|nr:hypothetical protein [Natronomonas sp.]MDR9431039.1 hypothetical protein [Natronomonas sp.]